MTRNMHTLVVAAVTLTLAAPLAFMQGTQSAPKMAYIDTRKVMEQMPGRAEVDAFLVKEMSPFEAKLKALVDSNEAITKKYQLDAPLLTEAGKAQREKEILEKRRVWQARSDTINEKARIRKSEIETPFMEALKKSINDVRQEDGFWMIFDLAADQAVGLVVGIDRNLDVTDRVIAKFKVAVAALPKLGTPAAGAPGTSGPPSVGVKLPPPAGTKPPPSPEP